MLKKILSISFIILYTFIIGANTFAFIYFKINQQYIAKNICVQKDRPENLCMGNCYLKAIQKKLHENDNKQEGTQTPNVKPPLQFETTLNKDLCIVYIPGEKNIIIIDEHTPLERSVEPLTPPPKMV